MGGRKVPENKMRANRILSVSSGRVHWLMLLRKLRAAFRDAWDDPHERVYTGLPEESLEGNGLPNRRCTNVVIRVP